MRSDIEKVDESVKMIHEEQTTGFNDMRSLLGSFRGRTNGPSAAGPSASSGLQQEAEVTEIPPDFVVTEEMHENFVQVLQLTQTVKFKSLSPKKRGSNGLQCVVAVHLQSQTYASLGQAS